MPARARRGGALGLDAASLARAANLVRATADHAPSAEDPLAAYVCDCDLAILAADPDRFADYERGVREEYAHVASWRFAIGRGRLLAQLLARPSIYASAWGRDRFEARARATLGHDLRPARAHPRRLARA